ncbi:MAG: hypothetical protein KDD47_06895 [Acidobacteria bacterium]|nr:hypothetical protein [Acidobacteriota bacterium]
MNRRLALFLAGLAAAVAAFFLLRNEKAVVLGRRFRGEPASGEPDAPRRCAGITRGGTRCTREAEPDSPFCWQHG